MNRLTIQNFVSCELTSDSLVKRFGRRRWVLSYHDRPRPLSRNALGGRQALQLPGSGGVAKIPHSLTKLVLVIVWPALCSTFLYPINSLSRRLRRGCAANCQHANGERETPHRLRSTLFSRSSSRVGITENGTVIWRSSSKCSHTAKSAARTKAASPTPEASATSPNRCLSDCSTFTDTLESLGTL
jgi:hypothetical protein